MYVIIVLFIILFCIILILISLGINTFRLMDLLRLILNRRIFKTTLLKGEM